MVYSFKNRVGSLRLVLGLAGLAFSVFLWGLGYKLSLYEPTQGNFHQIPRAKLLSEDERPSIAVASADPGRPAEAVHEALGVFESAFLLLLFTFCSFAEYITELRAPKNARPRRQLCAARFGTFLFRPPPCFVELKP